MEIGKKYETLPNSTKLELWTTIKGYVFLPFLLVLQRSFYSLKMHVETFYRGV